MGEGFAAVGDADFRPIAKQVKASGADVVLNTVSGAGNVGLFSAMYDAGIRPATVPIISYDLTEEELSTLTPPAEELAGNYAAWSYFQSLNLPANQEFIRRFRKRFGAARIVNDPMAAAYAGVHLWALGVNAAGSDKPAEIRRAMVETTIQAHRGISHDRTGQPAPVRMSRVGQVNKDLEFEIVFVSPKPIAPVVFRPRAAARPGKSFRKACGPAGAASGTRTRPLKWKPMPPRRNQLPARPTKRVSGDRVRS